VSSRADSYGFAAGRGCGRARIQDDWLRPVEDALWYKERNSCSRRGSGFGETLMRKSQPSNAYDRVLTSVFEKHWRPGSKDVPFTKDDLIDAAAAIGLRVKNIADILYTYRSR